MKYLVNERKYSLFLISILGSIIILSIPLIFNHLLDQSHLLHIVIHQIGFVLAAFMFILALISYSKTKITRMLFSSAAFGILAFGQSAYMYTKIDNHSPENMFSGGEILDICIVIMTVLFAIGVFYKR